MSLLLSNCKVFNHKGARSDDILVSDDGKISSVGRGLKGDKTIDLKGKIVIPGLIDAHVHLRDPGQTHKEDFYTGTSAALAGGVTTVFDMPNNSPPTTSQGRLDEKMEIAGKKAVCDYGFYIGATENNLAEIKNSDAVGIKIYMGSSTGDLLVENLNSLERIFSSCRKIVTVHAEENSVIRKEGTEIEHNAENHNRIRSPKAAEISLKRAINLAEKYGSRLHVAHMSTGAEMRLVSEARKRRLKVTCEVTPHHLFLDETITKSVGNFAKVNPPIRSKEDQKSLWNNLNLVDCMATDHAPHTAEEKQKHYDEAPSGIPGLETMLPLLLNSWNKGMIRMEEIVRLTSYGPSQIFGLKDKGQLLPGYDADFVVIDPKQETRIDSSKLFTKCKWTPFDGLTVKGKIERVFLRGVEAFDGESILLKKGEGRHVSH